jgi:ADP-ribose pyrophosphatase YjhB (NUDIX family)
MKMEEKKVVTSFLEWEGKILILRRSDKVRTYKGKWAGVSGYIEENPDLQALIEIKEETGLVEEDVELLRRGKPLDVVDEERGVKWIVHPYLFRVRSPTIKIDWESVEAKWILPEEMDKFDTVPMLKEALERVLR